MAHDGKHVGSRARVFICAARYARALRLRCAVTAQALAA